MEVQDPAAEARRHPARPGHGFEEPGGAAHGRAAAEMRGSTFARRKRASAISATSASVLSV